MIRGINAGRERAAYRRDGEGGKPNYVHSLAPKAVAECRADREKNGKSKVVGIAGPLQFGEAGVKAALDAGEGGCRNQRVERDRKGCKCGERQGPPAC
jgi:hypothetical protein